MKLRRITKLGDESLLRLQSLYLEAFPAEERRDIAQLEYLIENESRMFFNVIECEGGLAGLFVYWELEDFYYLEHLAVYPELRNQKVGQKVLDFVKEHLKGERLLEVECPSDEITTRRVNYYSRNGYYVVERDYIQPSYDGKREGMPLWIMANGECRDSEKLKRQIRMIVEEVYLRNYGIEKGRAGCLETEK